MHKLGQILLVGGSLLAASALPGRAAPSTLGLSGAVPNLESVSVENNHVYDYTFASAPTDWWVQSGVWEMTNRWSCSPGWSWFGGRSEEVAAVWNKRKFSGDLSAQFYFAFKMNLSGTPAWQELPSDMAVTICGDGQNLGTGYTFVVGADGNRRTVLLRNGKIVAETRDPKALLVSMADGHPASNDLHRRWWYVRVNKIGSRVECWLDNELVLTYHDDAPLDAGQMALWTYNNGIMLSRVQIYYENELRRDTRRTTAVRTAAAPASSKR